MILALCLVLVVALALALLLVAVHLLPATAVGAELARLHRRLRLHRAVAVVGGLLVVHAAVHVGVVGELRLGGAEGTAAVLLVGGPVRHHRRRVLRGAVLAVDRPHLAGFVVVVATGIGAGAGATGQRRLLLLQDFGNGRL